MSISLNFVVVLGMWAAQIFYVLCYVPQVIENFRRKSGRGISDLMLLGYYNGLVAVAYYAFLCDLPIAYKYLPLLQVVFTLVLILQRLLYDDFVKVKPYYFLYGGNVVFSLLFLPAALQQPAFTGWFAGWVMFVVSCINQLPQIVKIFQQKNVEGFSILFVVFFFMAAVLEFVTAWIIGLPVQTLFTACRGVIICLIWFGQFWLYR